MKNQRSINVTIGLNGEVEISADGYKGKSCLEASKFLEDALGLSTDKRTKKPEFFQQETVAQRQTT